MLWIILVGALGGMAPTLLKLAIDLTQQNTSIHNLNSSLFLGMALFGLLGAIVAGVWGEKNLQKVFYLGLGLPSFLTVATSHATAEKTNPSTAALFAPTHVFAATNPVHGRRLKAVLPPNVAVAQPQAVFETGEGDELAAIGDTPVAVPPTAQSVRLRSAIGTSNAIILPRSPGAFVTLTITTEKNRWYGFQYAVGIQADPYTLNATLAPIGNVTASVAAREPIALALGLNTGLFVLQRDGTVLTMGDGTLTPFSIVPQEYLAGDLTATTLSGAPRAFVSGITKIGIGFVLLLDHGAGNVIATLGPESGSLAGVAVDPGTRMVYAAAVSDPQIYAWSITGSGLTGKRVVARVPRATALGAMAMNASTQQLFVADPQEQKVYRITLGNHPVVTMFLAAHQTINALALDVAGRTLYIGGGNKLTAIGTDGVGEPQRVATTLTSISGVAVDNDRQVWVSDKGGEIQKIAP